MEQTKCHQYGKTFSFTIIKEENNAFKITVKTDTKMDYYEEIFDLTQLQQHNKNFYFYFIPENFFNVLKKKINDNQLILKEERNYLEVVYEQRLDDDVKTFNFKIKKTIFLIDSSNTKEIFECFLEDNKRLNEKLESIENLLGTQHQPLLNLPNINSELNNRFTKIESNIIEINKKFNSFLDENKQIQTKLANIEKRILTLEHDEDDSKTLDDISNDNSNNINYIQNMNKIYNDNNRTTILNNISNNLLLDQTSCSLSADDLKLISGWLPQEYKKFKLKLIYKSSINGNKCSNFRSNVNHIPNTLTIIITENGNRIGGYNPISNRHYRSDDFKKCEVKTAFIFSLTKKTKFIMQKGKLKKDDKKLGPCFGSYDMYFVNETLLNKCRCDIQKTFKNDDLDIIHNTKEAKEFMTGADSFEPKEIETYEVIKI